MIEPITNDNDEAHDQRRGEIGAQATKAAYNAARQVLSRIECKDCQMKGIMEVGASIMVSGAVNFVKDGVDQRDMHDLLDEIINAMTVSIDELIAQHRSTKQ